MKTIDEILKIMEYNATHVSEIVKTLKGQGKKIVGTFPVYAPIEIIHAAGMRSIDCWGGEKIDISRAVSYLPPFACSIVQSQTELAMMGAYDDLDAIVCSIPCDTFRCNNQNIRTACKVPFITCYYTAMNKEESSVHFMIKELKKVAGRLEEISGKEIEEAQLQNSIETCNAFRRELMRFSEILAKKPGLISPRERHNVFKAAGFMDKEEFIELIKSLNGQLDAESKPEFKGSRIYLAGIMTEPEEILDIMDELDFAIVGDELAQESRRYRVQIPEGSDPFERLAKGWQMQDSCTFVMPNFIPRKQYITESAKALGADGIIYCQMTFCDPELYDYPDTRNYAIEKGMPIISIDIDLASKTFEQVHTRLQSFEEQISLKV